MPRFIVEKLLTNKEAAAVLDVAPGTLPIWRCKRRYNLPFVRVGRNVRYREKDLLAWLESRKVHQAEAHG